MIIITLYSSIADGDMVWSIQMLFNIDALSNEFVLVRMVCLHCVYVIIVFAATLWDQFNMCCCATGETMIAVIVMGTVVPLCKV